MLKQTLFFSKPCKLSFRLKWLVEEEKKYTTSARLSMRPCRCGLLKKRKDIQPAGLSAHSPPRCGLLKKRKDIQPESSPWAISSSCGLLKKRKDIQPSAEA